MWKSSLLIIAFVVGCSSSSSTGSNTSSGAPSNSSGSSGSPGPTNTQPQMVFASQPYTLQPGDEKYYCYTTVVNDDVVFNGFVPDYGNATHHILLAQSIAAEKEGFEECTVIFKTTWVPMFVGGKGTTPIKFPDGAGYKIPKGTPVVLQLHLQNTGTEAVTASTSVAGQLLDATKPFTPAGIYGMDNRAIKIPPQATGYTTGMDCTAGKTLNVFSSFAHMHKQGQHIKVTRNDADVLYDANWDFNVQVTNPLTATVAPTDKLHLSCDFNNKTSQEVIYGESSDNEMCAFVLYYTPFDALDGCIQQPTP